MAVRVGKLGTKYVRFTIDVWLNEKTGEIHMTSTDVADFHTTLNDKPDSIRRHHNMFTKLKKILKDNNRWPA